VSGLFLSSLARKDLSDIWDYTGQRWGVDQADGYARRLADAMNLVAGDSARGRDCSHIRDGYWKYAVGSHILFYRQTEAGVVLIRILHRRMDYDRHLL